MRMNECPQCRQLTATAFGKLYCPHCGWNRAEVDRQARFLRFLPLLVALFDAPLILYVLLGHADVALLAALCLLAIVPAILVVLVVTGKLSIGARKRGPEEMR